MERIHLSEQRMSVIPGEVFVQFHSDGRFVLYNAFTRTCLAVDGAGLNHINELADHGETGEGPFQVWEIGYFSNDAGLLADPTRIRRDPADWPEPRELDGDSLEVLLDKLSLVVRDEAAYRARFGAKESVFDFKHFGNFHQQLGAHLMLQRRQDPVAWWYGQKFTEDRRSIQDNLYKGVQESYLNHYFPQRLKGTETVVDVGCGIGFYTNLMAQTAARAIGVDPSEEYIRLARENAADNATFHVGAVGEAGGLAAVADGTADIVFMSDALQFYFVPERPEQKGDLACLLEDIRRVLKPNGLFVSLEPHSTFFLQPWLGETRYPFSVVTEYRNRKFGITPPLSEVIQGLATAGFAVVWMDELYVDDSFQDTDARAYHFAREFPIWQLLEFKPLERPQ